MPFAVLFPGQGSQFVGMGGETLFEAQPDILGPAADETLGWSLRTMCLEGPEESLNRTEHGQVALFATALALWSELASRLDTPPAATAGHSVGEYTALAAAGVLEPQAALSVVAERGLAMGDAADLAPSGMTALLGADAETANLLERTSAELGGTLTVANDNAPGQIVMAGSIDDLDWLDGVVKDHGIRRAVRLKVAGGFHSPYMQPAADRVSAVLAELSPSEPAFPVYANVTAAPVGADDVVRLLGEQVVGRVRFRESLANMGEAGVDAFVHVGPGDVTAGLAKRSVPGATVITVSDLDGIGPAVDQLSTIDASGGA